MTTNNQNRLALRDYLDGVRSTLATGQAGEQAYRGAFENLFKGFQGGTYSALHEPLGVALGSRTLSSTNAAYQSAMSNVRTSAPDLEREENSEQLERYRNGLHNLILTDYLTFRWYVDGVFRDEKRLATRQSDGNLQPIRNGFQDVELLLRQFLDQDISLVNTPQEWRSEWHQGRGCCETLPKA